MAFLDKENLAYLWQKINNAVNTAMASKVDITPGKGLSSNDYTDTEKSKLAGIAEGANKTTVDTALSSSSTNPVQNKVVNTAITNLNNLVGTTKVSTQISNAIGAIDYPVDSVNGKTGAVSLTASDVGALPSTTAIPDSLSDLTADSTHRTVTDTEKATWNAKSNFSGSYNDLTNKPTIPSISGLATETYVNTGLSGKSDTDHTHSYAGSSSVGGAATSANKLNTNAGSTTQPVYFANGVPVKTTYTLAKSVPADAKFTDTTYEEMTIEQIDAICGASIIDAGEVSL